MRTSNYGVRNAYRLFCREQCNCYLTHSEVTDGATALQYMYGFMGCIRYTHRCCDRPCSCWVASRAILCDSPVSIILIGARLLSLTDDVGDFLVSNTGTTYQLYIPTYGSSYLLVYFLLCFFYYFFIIIFYCNK